MNLSDLISTQDDLHSIMHRDAPFPTPEQMQAKMKRLEPILESFRKCIRQCGQASRQFTMNEEIAIVGSTLLVIDDAIEYFTTKRKPS